MPTDRTAAHKGRRGPAAVAVAGAARPPVALGRRLARSQRGSAADHDLALAIAATTIAWVQAALGHLSSGAIIGWWFGWSVYEVLIHACPAAAM